MVSSRRRNHGLVGKEIFEVTPVILGGSPDDPKNKTYLDRESHMKAVRYWNRVIAQMRASGGQAGARCDET
jgi:hypothetical protein